MNVSCPRCGTPFDPERSPEGLCPQCAFSGAIAAAPTAVDDLVQHLPNLEDIRVVGRGGMGVVYRARQKHLNRDVAVKVISGQFTADAEFQKRFQQEAQVLASLDHPNIVKVHEFGIAESLRYFVMEFVEGTSLRESNLGSDDILRAVYRVAEALAYAHGRGIAHRDIKPENVLLREDGTVKVVDFGIARLADETRLTESGAAIGTPAYMAPEQRDDPHTADHRVDIYALGVLAYEMLTGQVPAGTFPPPSRVADVDERVDEIVLRAMDRNPARRFQTAQEMANALREVVEPEVAAAVPPRLPLRHRLRRLKASRLFWILATGAAFELAFLTSRLDEGVAPDPRAVFERFLPKNSWARRGELLKAFGDPRVSDEADAVLAREAGGKDPVRSAVALEIAHDLKRLDAIPPDARARALVHWQKDNGRDNSIFGLYDRDLRGNLLMESIEEGGPSVAREIFLEIASGEVPDENRMAAILGVARAADPSLVKSMYDWLRQHRHSPATPDVLFAFAACADLPVPRSRFGEQAVSPEIVEIYFRHLPDLLDSSTQEALWPKALELAVELRLSEGAGGNASTWLTAHGVWYHEGLPLPTDAASLAEGVHLPWPLDDDAARRAEQEIRSRSDLAYPYVRALLIHWRKTGRLTLPPYRWPVRFGSFVLTRIGDREAALALLDSSDDVRSIRWEAHAIWIPTIAGEPEPLDPVVGQGNVKATLSRVVDEPGTAVSVHYGMQSIVASSQKRKFGSFKVEIEGAFSKTKSGKLTFNGNVTRAFSTGHGYGGGGGTAGERCWPEEASFLEASLKGHQSGDLRYGWFTFLVVDPPAHGEPSQRWRPALVRTLERLAKGVTGWSEPHAPGESVFSRGADDMAVSVAAWIPLSEAREALLKLWSRPDAAAFHREHIGAALLLLGDPTPLAETAWMKEISPEVALRVYLFSSSAAARRAVEPYVGKPETNSDAEKILKRLEARGETDTPLAKTCREKLQAERTSRIKFFLPYLFGGLLVLSFGWFVPLGPNRRASVAYGLVLTGLVLRFLTFQVGERLWMPAAGDLLILIASFLYGGWTTRILAAALAVSGTLQLMMPGSAPILFASGLLLCLYIGMMTGDLLTRWLPTRLKKLEFVALLATIWALVIPVGFMYATGLVLSLARDSFTFSLFTLQGGWATAFVIAMIAGPLWLVRAQRVRLASR